MTRPRSCWIQQCDSQSQVFRGSLKVDLESSPKPKYGSGDLIGVIVGVHSSSISNRTTRLRRLPERSGWVRRSLSVSVDDRSDDQYGNGESRSSEDGGATQRILEELPPGTDEATDAHGRDECDPGEQIALPQRGVDGDRGRGGEQHRLKL